MILANKREQRAVSAVVATPNQITGTFQWAAAPLVVPVLGHTGIGVRAVGICKEKGFKKGEAGSQIPFKPFVIYPREGGWGGFICPQNQHVWRNYRRRVHVRRGGRGARAAGVTSAPRSVPKFPVRS